MREIFRLRFGRIYRRTLTVTRPGENEKTSTSSPVSRRRNGSGADFPCFIVTDAAGVRSNIPTKDIIYIYSDVCGLNGIPRVRVRCSYIENALDCILYPGACSFVAENDIIRVYFSIIISIVQILSKGREDDSVQYIIRTNMCVFLPPKLSKRVRIFLIVILTIVSV